MSAASSSNPAPEAAAGPRAGSRLHTARAHATPPLPAAQALPRHCPPSAG